VLVDIYNIIFDSDFYISIDIQVKYKNGKVIEFKVPFSRRLFTGVLLYVDGDSDVYVFDEEKEKAAKQKQMKEDEAFEAYVLKWEEQLEGAMSIVHIAKSDCDTADAQPVLTFQTRVSPAPYKTDLTLYANGCVHLWAGEGYELVKTPETKKDAVLSSELMEEIQRLVNDRTLHEQKSATRRANDKDYVHLTLYRDEGKQIIYRNTQYTAEGYGLAYRCLEYLLDGIAMQINAGGHDNSRQS
jgi:hypothetical protein